ncbi:MAG: hypothetical protein F9K27_11985 [Anaerolineae bacterium]|nr:MAG: hypothetical protein F9K27_11985 [Anaerolineae bacterium]
MRRNALILLILLVFALLAAACTDDPPSDVSGCNLNPNDPTDTAIYDNDRGCLYGAKEPVAHGEGEHGEETEHSEEVEGEEHSEEGEPTQEATEAAD